MKTKLIYIVVVTAISILSSCKGQVCYECNFPGEKSGSDFWTSMPNKQTICQNEGESDEAFKERIDNDFRNEGYSCAEK